MTKILLTSDYVQKTVHHKILSEQLKRINKKLCTSAFNLLPSLVSEKIQSKK